MGLDNPLHIAILLVILLLVFGAKRLPEIGRSLGEGMRGFKDSLTGNTERDKIAAPQPQPPQQPAEHVPSASQAAEQPSTPAAPTPEAQ